jgi:hypothetical protein
MNGDTRQKVATTVVSFSNALFPEGAPQLRDYTVTVPEVQSTDLWAGQHIGIQFESTVSQGGTSGGNWDIDNLRLTTIPEPTAFSLLALGLGGWLVSRRRG